MMDIGSGSGLFEYGHGHFGVLDDTLGIFGWILEQCRALWNGLRSDDG